MKTKRVISALCAAAVTLSSLTIGISSYSSAANTYAEEISTEEAEETKELAAPQNLRYEDGFIKWDKVKEAYGYTLRMHLNEGEYQEYTKYFDYDDPDDEAQVELDRLCYENNIDFGEYAFDVCIFDEAGNRSEWTDTVIAEFAPTLAAPTNVRLSEDREETVEWDEVEGTYRYNIRIYNDDDDRTLYYSTYRSSTSYSFDWLLDSNADFWISIQAMNQDYNVSAWTEPVKLSIIAKEWLETPQNVRLDESGENIIWDEVEGAEYYQVDFWFTIEKNGSSNTVWCHFFPEQAQLDNWKSNVIPSANGEYNIGVYACSSHVVDSNRSETLTVPCEPVYDETIEMPKDLQPKEGYLQWNTINTAKTYYISILRNSAYIENIQTAWRSVEDYHWDLDEYSNNLSYYIGNHIPEGDYEAELFVVDENGNYNSKTYSFTLNTPHDETVWVPKVFYKGDTLLWDYDRIRHDNTGYFWIRVKNAKNYAVVMLKKSGSEYFYGLNELPNGEYTIETCVYEYSDKLGPWSKPLNITVFDGSYFDEENKSTVEIVPPPEIEETIPEEDRITSITINPAFNMKHKDGDDVEIDLSKIEIKANEIYDEEGLKRVEEALGHKIKPNQKYNLLDLTLLYNGEDFSNGYEGLVQVIIPIPAGHRDKTFTVYRLIEVDGKTVKEVIPGEQTEDSYIIYLEHFSEYALFGEGDHTHDFTSEWVSDETNHWKECECGEKSDKAEHAYTDWTVTKEATENEEGSKERSCETCGYKQEETIPELSHTHSFGEEWKNDETNHWKECECGEKSDKAEHSYTDWTVTKEATETEEGSRERSCEICRYKQTEVLPKLTSGAPSFSTPGHFIDNTNGSDNKDNTDNDNNADNNANNNNNTNSTNNTVNTGRPDTSTIFDGTNNTDNSDNTADAEITNNTNNTNKPEAEPEGTKGGDNIPSTGITAVSTSVMLLSACSAAIVLISKKKNTK